MIRSNKLVWASATILLAGALASCNIGKAPEPTTDVNAIYTSAAQTMVAGFSAEQTQTAAAAPPTASSPVALLSPTALATFGISTGSVPFGTPFTFTTPGIGTTPLPTLPSGTGVFSFPVGCNDATYIGETKPYDKTQMDTNNQFDKGWSMQNSGTCTWDEGYSFSYKSGDKMAVNDLAIQISSSSDFTAPGHSQSFVVHMQAPNKAGEFKSFWQMKSDKGEWFGSIVYVDIIVIKPGSSTSTPTP